MALGLPVGEAMRRIDSAEFAEWFAYYQIEPWGEERADLRSGIQSATVANCAAQGRKQFKAEDFMPRFGRTRRRMSNEEMQARLMLASRAAVAIQQHNQGRG